MALLQWYRITSKHITLKFNVSLDTKTFVNENFTLSNTDATPSLVIANPFDPISVKDDYQSIGRELYLYWNATIQPDTKYSLTISNLKDIFGNTKETTVVEFCLEDSATPSDPDYNKDKNNPDLENKSIRDVLDLGLIDSDFATATNDSATDIELVNVSPGTIKQHYASVTENDGRIDLLFDNPIAMNYVNNTYFLLSEKTITTGINPWKSLVPLVLLNNESTKVSVYLPSNDVIPVYSYLMTDEEIKDLIFFRPKTKYKLVIKSSVGL